MCVLDWSDVTVKKIPGSKNKSVVHEVGGRSGFRDIPASAKAVSFLEELGMKADSTGSFSNFTSHNLGLHVILLSSHPH